jgi:hypothetical protein
VTLDALFVNEARLSSRPHHEGNTLTLNLEGEADLEMAPFVGRVLEGVHREAQRLGVAEVALDLSQLQFVSAPGLKQLIGLLRDAAGLPESIAYRIRVISSPLIPWQKRGLNALRCFAPDIVTIESPGAAKKKPIDASS